MASFNKVILVGNLTRDPQVKYLASGTAVTELGLAVSYQWFDKQTNTKKEETTFVDVSFFGRTAEVAGEYLSKGKQVLVEGRLKLDTWEDRETKQKRSKMRVHGETMTMLGSRSDGGGGGGGSGGRSPAARDQVGGNQGGGDQGGGDQGGFSQEADSYPSYEDTSSGSSGGPPSDEVPF